MDPQPFFVENMQLAYPQAVFRLQTAQEKMNKYRKYKNLAPKKLHLHGSTAINLYKTQCNVRQSHKLSNNQAHPCLLIRTTNRLHQSQTQTIHGTGVRRNQKWLGQRASIFQPNVLASMLAMASMGFRPSPCLAPPRPLQHGVQPPHPAPSVSSMWMRSGALSVSPPLPLQLY